MKKTKIKLVAAAAALAMTFALAVTATGCSDGGDATTTDETTTEDASGGSSSGSGSGSGSETDSGSSSGTDDNSGSGSAGTTGEIAEDGTEVTVDTKVLWEGSTTLTWDSTGAIKIEASKLSAITENTVFKFTYSVTEGATYTNLNIKNSTEDDIITANPKTDSTYYTTIIGDADAVTEFKTNGIIIKGSNMTVTKIETLGEQVTEKLTYENYFAVRTDLEAIQNKAYAGYSKIVISGKYNEFTPAYGWDGVAALCGWEADVGEDWGAYNEDEIKNFGWNTGCSIADYSSKVNTEYTVSFNMDDVLSCNDKIYRYGINIYKSDGDTAKVTVESVVITYIAK